MNDFILFMQERLGCRIDQPLDALKLARALITTSDKALNDVKTELSDLTEQLSQCKIELQATQDSLMDANHQLKEDKWTNN